MMILRLGLFILLSAIYVFFAVMSTGGGHGTFVFFAPLFTLPLCLVALALTNRLKELFPRVIFVVLMCVHYAHTLLFLSGASAETWEETVTNWMAHGFLSLFTFGLYLTGQFGIWFYFVKGLKDRDNESSIHES